MKGSFILVFMFIFVACSSVKTFELDESKPIQIEKQGYFSKLKQDGELVDYFDLVAKLGQNPNTEYHAQVARIYFSSAVGTTAVSGWYLAHGLLSDDNRGKDILFSLGFFAGSVYLSYFTNKTIVEASKIYNQRFDKRSSSLLERVRPQVSYREKGPFVGLSLTF